MNNWTIRKANLQDRDAIVQLLKESFSGYWTSTQSIYSHEFWNWLYRDNPGGGSITFVAEAEGRIIAHYPSVLENLKVNDNIYLAGMVLHLTTHLDYRRKGIFKNLGKSALEELTRGNIPFSLAFPNDKSLPGFINKLGFSQIANLPLLIKPIRIKRIIRAIIKHPFFAQLVSFLLYPLHSVLFHNWILQRRDKDVKIEPKQVFDYEFDSLWIRSMSQAKVMVRRDAEFLTWRFNQRPKQKYNTLAALKNNELAGYIITRKADISSLRVGIVMDYLVLPKAADIFRALLNNAIDNFRKEEMDLCIAASLKNNMYYKTLRRAGFIAIPPRFNPRRLILVGRLNQDTADKGIFLDKRNWFVTFGDWDVF
jgi:predicted N-acetyltransferase YhbS